MNLSPREEMQETFSQGETEKRVKEELYHCPQELCHIRRVTTTNTIPY